MEADEWEVISEFTIPSEQHHVIKAVEDVIQAVDGLGISKEQIFRLKTAVSEAVMNAAEHGNKFNPCLEVDIQVRANRKMLLISVSDQGAGGSIPKYETPDLQAKLVGKQSPRGWGFFLIEKMVDRMEVREEAGRNIIDLYLYRE